MTEPDATAVIVVFNTASLDLSWIPDPTPVLIVHNDKTLDPLAVTHPSVIHVGDGTNIGFGRGVNLALQHVQTPRVVLANPDTILGRQHWSALTDAGPHDVVVVPLVDADGTLTTTVNAYPTAASVVLTALRVGRILGRRNPVRRALLALLGNWGREHALTLEPMSSDQTWPATTHWAAASVCSYPTSLLQQIGGFDPEYFLYLEDIDLCARLAQQDPKLRIVRRAVDPGLHAVSGTSIAAPDHRRANLEHARSALLYASRQVGASWRQAQLVLGPLVRWRQHRLEAP